MPTFKFTPKDIYEADFSTKMRGYDKEEVDELLDDVIADYETYQTENLRLQEENEFLKKKIAELEMQVSKPNQANLGSNNTCHHPFCWQEQRGYT